MEDTRASNMSGCSHIWLHHRDRAGTVSLGDKKIKFWDDNNIILSEKYPAYPDFWRSSSSSINFDISQNTGVKKWAICLI
jgi:hypothetical protein